VWERPDEFHPERFSAEQRKHIPRGAYIPFGAGPRMCIGMRLGQLELRTTIARVLRDFTLMRLPNHPLELRLAPVLGPTNGLRMRIAAALNR
jgi:cytochrome P450